MTRSEANRSICISLLFAAVLFSSCSHSGPHVAQSQTEAGKASVASGDSAYTGLPPQSTNAAPAIDPRTGLAVAPPGGAPLATNAPLLNPTAPIPANPPLDASAAAAAGLNPTQEPPSTMAQRSTPPPPPIDAPPPVTAPPSAMTDTTTSTFQGAPTDSTSSSSSLPSTLSTNAPAADGSMTRLTMDTPSPTVATPPKSLVDVPVSRVPVAVFDTSMGRIIIQLDDVTAPRTCGNFRKLVNNGFYNNTAFHRIIPNFIIQAGDPNTKNDDHVNYGQGGPGYTLPAEINLKHERGAVAMARLPDSVNPERDSNGSQFYICVAACPTLDDNYTVFGHVIVGMDVVDKIAAQPHDVHSNPLERIDMKAHMEPKNQALEEASVPPAQ